MPWFHTLLSWLIACQKLALNSFVESVTIPTIVVGQNYKIISVYTLYIRLD